MQGKYKLLNETTSKISLYEISAKSKHKKKKRKGKKALGWQWNGYKIEIWKIIL